jgi:hypothetical protein
VRVEQKADNVDRGGALWLGGEVAADVGGWKKDGSWERGGGTGARITDGERGAGEGRLAHGRGRSNAG